MLGNGFAAAGRPVAMKILSPDILHKTDIGGVMLNLKTEDEAFFAYQEILDNAAAHAPGAKIDGVMLSPMIGDGVDLILGRTNRSYLWGDGNGWYWRYTRRAIKGRYLYARPYQPVCRAEDA
jgi:hypothetical protein